MGIRNGVEIGRRRVSTAHVAVGNGAAFIPSCDARSANAGFINFAVTGVFVGTVIAQRTFDGGTTWVDCKDVFGNAASLTAPGAMVLREIEPGVDYRTRCSAYTSGTATARLGQ